MHVLIAYSTTEGQSAKIARFAADLVGAEGHEVTLADLADLSSDLGLSGAERVILAGSVHERRHSQALETFMQAKRDWLSARPVLLLSVSLSAAFEDGLDEAQDYVTETAMRTGFTPGDVMLVAGAVKPSGYDYFASQVMQFVVLRDRSYEMGVTDHEFTDWSALADRLRQFLAAPAGTAPRAVAL